MRPKTFFCLSRNPTVKTIILGKHVRSTVKKILPKSAKQEDFQYIFSATRVEGVTRLNRSQKRYFHFRSQFSRDPFLRWHVTTPSSFCIIDSASKFLIIRCSRMPPILATGLRRHKTWKEYFFDTLQVVHFLIAMGFLWAGVVEFIRNPPYFDAYGDATTLNDLPEGLFEVRVTEDLFIKQ